MWFKSRSPSARSARARRTTGSIAIEGLEDRRLLSFAPATDHAAGSMPYGATVADFNGDGRPDVVVANNDADRVSVLLGSGNGTFQAPLASATGDAPSSIAVGDFNGDGRQDVVTANLYDVSVLLGHGTGTFAAPSAVTLAFSPTSVAVGDFNADGKMDLAATSNAYTPPWWGYYSSYPAVWHGRIQVLLGNGVGSFAASGIAHSNSANQLTGAAVADFNGDGDLDIAAADTGDHSWGGGDGALVAYGDGAGGLGQSAFVASARLTQPRTVGAADVNGDGRSDLLTVGYGNLGVFLGTGAGGLGAGQIYDAGPFAEGGATADVNGDGRADVVSAGAIGGGGGGGGGGGVVNVVFNAGGGVFRPPVSVTVASQSRFDSVATGDFNADGRVDAVAVNATSGKATVLLNDGTWPDAGAPRVTPGGVTVAEGDTGTVNAAIPVTLSVASTKTVTLKYATADGTATAAAGDYVAASGTLTFAPGETTQTINVRVNGDHVGELTETFSVVLSDVTNGFLGNGDRGTVAIVDNEPTVSVGDHTAAEGNTGTTSFTFTVRLSAASGAPVTVNYSTAEGDTDLWPANPYSYYSVPAATAGSDFVSKSGMVTFAAGETSKRIVVLVNGDRTGEPHEAFSVNLAGAGGARIDDAHGVGSITDDEPYANLSGGQVTEGNSSTRSLPFVITLSTASDAPVTVTYATGDDTATVAGGDYVAKAGTVTFAPGETTKTVNVTVNGDRRGEPDEALHMTLTGATGATPSNTLAYGLIVDNEPRLSVNSVSLKEGNGGTRTMTFRVTLSAAYDQAVTVKIATENGSATTSGNDYVAKSGTLTFLPGQTSKTFTVTIKGDTKREWDEEFYVRLSAASVNALILDEYGAGRIQNDDGRPR